MFGKRNCTTFLALMLIVALTLTLAGCGGGTPAGGEKKAESPAGDVIKIGTNFEMTGGQATFGQAALNGVKLAFKQKNEAGGVLGGKKFEAVSGDNKSAPEESANVVTKLIDQAP
nr:ABC transporter substrate-binding protein [Clostridia bacterium]